MFQVVDQKLKEECDDLIKDWLFSGAKHGDLAWNIYHFIYRKRMESDIAKIKHEPPTL